MDGLAYYVLVECPKCDEEIHWGPCASFLDEHRGLPVIGGDELAQQRVDCSHCEARIYFGELDYFVEGDVPGGGGDDD